MVWWVSIYGLDESQLGVGGLCDRDCSRRLMDGMRGTGLGG